ncbi:MAG: hypothetical protein R2780_06265 [Crocinitomicaceae bacterium]|nr:hypothetical protein [Crocinitomicaceae bacterium]
MQKVFLLATLLVFSLFTSYSQVNISAPEGSFEDFFKWGDGYIGDVQRNMVATLPKEREFIYYDGKGTKKWSRSIDPKSGWNDFLVNENGNYAYFIDVANLTEGGIWQREYPTDLFIIYRLDKAGTMEKINVNYGDHFSAHFGADMKGFSLESFIAGENELLAVISQSSAKNDWTKKYCLFRIGDDKSMRVNLLDFQLTESDWKAMKKSELHFQREADKIYLMQMNAISNGFEFRINTYGTSDLSEISSVTNTYSLESGINYGQFVFEQVTDPQMAVRTQYSYVTRKGDTYYTIFTLGALINLQVDNGQLYGVGNYYVDGAKGSLRPDEMKGIYALKFNTESIDELSGNRVIKYDVPTNPKDKVYEISVLMQNSKFNCGMIAKKTFGYSVNGSPIKQVEIKNGYSSIVAALGESLNNAGIQNISNACIVYEYKNEFVILEKVKIAPALNGIKELNIYTIKK